MRIRAATRTGFGAAALLTLGLFYFGLAPGSARAATLWVDAGAGACADYDAGSRSCGGGAEQSFATPAAAMGAADPTDEIVLRGGTYGSQLEVTVSGTAGSPFVVRAMTGEEAALTGIGEAALLVDGRSHVQIEGLTVRDVVGWARIVDSDHIVLRDVVFEQATAGGTTGGVKIIRTAQSAVVGCTLDDGNDNLTVIESERILIADNRFSTGAHSLLSVRCSNSNIIRGNRFSNPDQKSVEIYDCEESASDVPFILDATRRNVVEGNNFVLTLGSDQPHRYNAIQYAGQLGIVRRNVFYDNAGGGLAFQVYPDEALFNYGHRAYHNTFVDNRCYGIIGSNDVSSDFHDNLVRNNVLYRNVGCAGEAAQTSIANEAAVALTDNVLADADPGFVDVDGRDLTLTDGSPLVDAAAFLAHTVGAGSGTALSVDDASWFHDGLGVEGAVGDLIQLDGSAVAVRIVAVDLDTDLLTLDTSIDWADGVGVSLAFAGAAPDVGAFERGLTTTPPDGGVPPGRDGSVTPGRDGGSTPGPDGGPGAGGDSDGCGCIAAGNPQGVPLPWLAGALAISWWFRRLHRPRRR